MNTDNTILVALDGSEKSMKTVEYLASFKPFLNKEIVLYTVISSVPECYYDMKNEPFNRGSVAQTKAWEVSYRNTIQTFMDAARMKLIAAGFKPEMISIAIEKRKKGVARDILGKCRDGYHALLTRRRGRATFLPIVLGSVSTKLVEKADGIPLLLAGTEAVNHSVMIAMDGSAGAWRALDFLADTIRDSQCRVTLCSVLRDYDAFQGADRESLTETCIKNVFEEIDDVMQTAEKKLADAGIPPRMITNKIIQGAASRAGALIEAAQEEKCDTIVFGRRGKSDVPTFDIGRVPWKVIHGARHMSVWVIP